MKKQNKEKIPSFEELSNCCGEEMKIVGGDEGTMFYQCLGCSRGCDPMIPKKLSNIRKPRMYSFDEVEKLLKEQKKEIGKEITKLIDETTVENYVRVNKREVYVSDIWNYLLLKLKRKLLKLL